ncbi:aldo/keto reductase [Clostridium perfringens]|uniref:aldo/keto reductase n=1 Tax=Clostridium perfringens TaxID=1502 RepID=UPI00111EE5DC|nr:aldo/keto reductase [Clostridium perfringens]TPE20795.1 aldo/keto reductase [Clostridium perfringens]
MTNNLNNTITLNNGIEMPRVGLGVFRVENSSELVNAVKVAIKNGYRSIDGAAIYGNEEAMGEGIREGIKEAGISREDLFITSKVWNADLGYESTIAAYEASLKRLGVDYLDLYLIHWPVEGKYKEAWRALEYLYKEGRVKAIGVSNFQVHHLQDLLKYAEIKPVINQIELHPYLSQEKVREFCKENDIQVEAWSPLMAGNGLLENDILKEIAKKYNKTTAQVVLRWDLQNQVITIPKSTNEGRLVENIDIFGFNLSKDDMDRIDSLNKDLRVGPDPDNFDF